MAYMLLEEAWPPEPPRKCSCSLPTQCFAHAMTPWDCVPSQDVRSELHLNSQAGRTFDGLDGGNAGEVRLFSESQPARSSGVRESARTSAPKPSQLRPAAAARPMFIIGPRATLMP